MPELKLPAPAVASNQQGRAGFHRQLVGGARHTWERFCERLRPPATNESLEDVIVFKETSHLEKDAAIGGGDVSLNEGKEHEEIDSGDSIDTVVVENGGFNCYEDCSPNAKDTPTNADRGTSEADSTSLNSSHGPFEVDSVWEKNRFVQLVRRFAWPAMLRFTSLSHSHTHMEEQYWRQRWASSKRLSMMGGLWLVINWIISVAFARRPFHVFDSVFFYLVCPILVLPLPVMILLDLPYGGKSVIYQVWLTLAVWSWTIFTLIDVYLCGFFGTTRHITCADFDFFNIIYYSCALPAIALFALHQNRLPSLLGVTVSLGLMLGLIVPVRASFLRHVIEIGVFHLFLLYTNYIRENAERRVFHLKEQIKVHYQATQKAQVAERQTADSKRRLMNYIFHEVRVPLNTATLAFQNLEASGVATPDTSLEFSAIGGSLSMMSQDILDFNKMDAGQLSTISKPYNFHQALRSMMPGAQMTAEHRGLKLVTDFDPNIDLVARRALYHAQGLPKEAIVERLADETLDDALVVSDEMRVRQVVTNLTSNALKFSHRGAKSVMLRTRLIFPTPSDCGESSDGLMSERKPLGSGAASISSDRKLSRIVVRIEVEDHGVGIRANDMIGHRLFSPYVQTEIGKSQGGKGTGLGLALIKHIVALSGGRLGVRSELGVGSLFWVEIPLGVGMTALNVPTWPEVLESDSPALGDDWPALPSPHSTRQNTPALQPIDVAGLTPSTLGPHSSTTAPLDYIGSVPTTTSMASSATMVEALSSQPPRPPSKEELTRVVSRPPALDPPHESAEITAQLASVEAPGVAVVAATPEDLSNRESTMMSSRRQVRPMFIPLPPPAHMSSLSSSSAAEPGPSTLSTTPVVPGSSSNIGVNMRILVVDDDLLTRRLMGRMLQRLGCTVESAEDGQMALSLLLYGNREQVSEDGAPLADPEPDAADGSTFACIFLDNQMPNLTGVELTRRLRRMGRKDLIVGVTGNALAEDQKEYSAAGADYILTKPVREEKLKDMLLVARSRTLPQTIVTPAGEDPPSLLPKW